MHGRAAPMRGFSIFSGTPVAIHESLPVTAVIYFLNFRE